MAIDDDIKELKNLILKMNERLDTIEDDLKDLSFRGPIASAPTIGQEEPGTLKKSENSYTAEEALDYFGSVLNEFNSKAAKAGGNIEYIASSVEANLKSQAYKDDEFLMTGVDVSKVGESGVSSVKISIKAVPKQTK
jgi:hypothetical protein